MILIEKKDKKKLLTNLFKRILILLEKYNIRYYVAYGTLLGTVRHKGFIPWDDDIDLFVIREDYFKFIHILKENKELLEELNLSLTEFGYYKGDIYRNMKITDNRTTMEEYGRNRDAIFIDIWPIDCVSKKHTNFYIKIINMFDSFITLCETNEVDDFSGNKKYIFKFLLFLFKLYGLDKCKINFENKLKSLTKYKENSYYLITSTREKWDSKCYINTVEMEFENILVKCPKEYDTVLKYLYGDYMKLPPENERYAHDSYVMYWKDKISQEEIDKILSE